MWRFSKCKAGGMCNVDIFHLFYYKNFFHYVHQPNLHCFGVRLYVTNQSQDLRRVSPDTRIRLLTPACLRPGPNTHLSRQYRVCLCLTPCDRYAHCCPASPSLFASHNISTSLTNNTIEITKAFLSHNRYTNSTRLCQHH